MDCRFQFLDQRAQIHALADWLIAHQPAAHPVKRRKVHIDQLLDEWTLDLDDDIPELPCFGRVRPQTSAVNLTQRGSRKWYRFEGLEFFFKPLPQLCLCQLSDRFKVFCRYFILQTGKLLGDLDRQDIEAGGEKLPDLDHDATHPDRHGTKLSRNLLITPRTRPPCQRAQAQAREDELPQNKTCCRAGKETHDVTITSA